MGIIRTGISFVIFGWFCSAGQLSAQVQKLPSKHLSEDYVIKTFTVEDGLPSNTILDLGFDQNNNVWVGTNDGLAFIDGTSVRGFSSHNEPIVGNTSYYSIAGGNDNKVWFSSMKDGLIYYKDSQFSISESSDQFKSSLGKFISVKNDSIWLSLFNSGLVLIVDGEIKKEYSTENGLISNEIWSTYLDKSGNVWVVTNYGLSIIKDGEVINYDKDSGMLGKSLRGIEETENGSIWVGSNRGINIFQNYKLTSKTYTFDGNSASIETLKYDRLKKQMWVGNGADGLYKIDLETNKISNFTKEDGLLNNYVHSIEMDAEGNIWIATNGGVMRLSSRDVVPLIKDEFRSGPMLGLNKTTNGVILVGSTNGFYMLEDLENEFKASAIYSFGTISNINETEAGDIIAGSATGGIGILEDDFSWKIMNSSTDSISDYVQDISIIKDEAWVTVQNGIFVLGKSFNVADKFYDNDAFFINSEEYQENKMLVGTYQDGIKLVSKDSDTITVSQFLDTSTPVVALKKDNQGSLFYTDNEGHIYRYTNNEVFKYGFKIKSLTNSLNSIYIDKNNTMWILSSQGLFKTYVEDYYNPEYVKSKTVPFLFFNKDDGLTSYSSPANDNQIIETDAQKLILATNGGLFFVPPEVSRREIKPQKPVLSSVIVNGNSTNSLLPVRVNNENNSLRLSFSMPNNFNKTKSMFAYRLRGVKDSLNYLYDRNEIILDFLESGEHIFEVYGTNEMGTWNEEPLIVEVIKEYPFYRKWWFLGICFLGLFGSGAGGVYIRSNMKLRALNRELETQQKIQAERERISRELHDNVGSQITNLITGIEVSNLHVKKNQQDEALSLLENLDSDARGAMTDLRETIWLLDKEKVEFGVFIDHLRGYLRRQERYLDDLNVTLDSSVNNESVLNPGQSLNLTRIIQEALNNTRKYAEATTFSVLCTQDENVIQVRIKDDGKGMDIDEELKKGNGLNNMAHRAKEMNGQFEINSKKGNGTEIRLSFEVKIP